MNTRTMTRPNERVLFMHSRRPRTPGLHATRQVLALFALALAVAVLAPHQASAASPAPVDLGSASQFTILAGSAITSTGGGTVVGDVGLSPTAGTGITGLTTGQVSGTIYTVDGKGPVGAVMDLGLLTTAKADLTTAYSNAQGRSVGLITLENGENLGGQTLLPGLYGAATSLEITGDLILDGGGDLNAVWIFQMGSTLTTAAGAVGAPQSRVILVDGARSVNIFWQVGSSATIGTYSVFKGIILADQSITMNTGSMVDGKALAIGAQVTFDAASAGILAPTRAHVVSFGADNRAGEVWAWWLTDVESRTIGFRLDRSDKFGEWHPVHPLLIPAQFDDAAGGSYEVADKLAEPGGTYTYRLNEVENDGAVITHGPYTVTITGLQPTALTPEVDNGTGASNVLSISTVLTGTLTWTGGSPTQVRVYWGETDGETTFADWGHTNDLGTNAVGPLSSEATGLVPNRVYYYRFYATNEYGDAWASATTNFQTLASVGPAPVNLRSTAHFTILAGAEITTTGGGMINGDIGASPIAGSAIGIPPSQVNGFIYAVDATGTQAPNGLIDPGLLTTAKGDLMTAFNETRDRTPVPTGTFLNPGGGNIGGLNLIPGLYKFTGEAHIEGSDVTLTGGPKDVWIFQVASALIVGADGRKVILAGGARAENIFWQVGTSATIGTFAVFKGTIMADQAITMDTKSVMEGRALAFSAGVTFNSDGGSLPSLPDGPIFTDISTPSNGAVTVVLDTAPYYDLTLQTCTDLLLTNWTTRATDTPVGSSWTYTDNTAMAGVTQRFYRAFITP